MNLFPYFHQGPPLHQRKLRPFRPGFAAIALCAIAALTLMADDGNNPSIYRVVVSGTSTQPVFTITGTGFGNRDTPWVWLGSQSLTLASHTDTTIVTHPAPSSAMWVGTFDLLVASGHGNRVPSVQDEQKNWSDSDEVSITLGSGGSAGPAGPTGPAGAVGATGPAGPVGAAGATGAAGPIGATGAMGAAGTAGAIGAIGPAGPAGVAGPNGPAGTTGAAGTVGAIGPVGPAGPAGVQGPQGVPGPQGVAGASLLSAIGYATNKMTFICSDINGCTVNQTVTATAPPGTTRLSLYDCFNVQVNTITAVAYIPPYSTTDIGCTYSGTVARGQILNMGATILTLANLAPPF